jgi:hypothetical protein
VDRVLSLERPDPEEVSPGFVSGGTERFAQPAEDEGMLELDPYDGAGLKGSLGPCGVPVGKIGANVFVDQTGGHAAGEVFPYGGSDPGLAV